MIWSHMFWLYLFIDSIDGHKLLKVEIKASCLGFVWTDLANPVVQISDMFLVAVWMMHQATTDSFCDNMCGPICQNMISAAIYAIIIINIHI